MRGLTNISDPDLLIGSASSDDAAVYRLSDERALVVTRVVLHGESLDKGGRRVLDALETTLADQNHGRWILSSQHSDAHSELALTVAHETGARDIVIDRTFVDVSSGERWVVDYKSSSPPAGNSMAAFLAEEGERYREQLRAYRDAVASRGPEPVRCALYFTSLGEFYHLAELDG